MTAKAGNKKAPQRPPTPNPERERRLAEALRSNLRRRKGQARDREDEAADPTTGKAPKDPASGD